MDVMFTLAGGIGLFLLGMSMMTGGLKVAAGDALRSLLNSWTSSNLRGLSTGFLVTAVVQSSSAVTVATVGFVNAGLLTLQQAVWVIFGTNVGTTVTSWLVAAVGVKIDVGELALPLLGIGMLLSLSARPSSRRGGVGHALAGFGIFFLGINILQEGFSQIASEVTLPEVGDGGWLMLPAFASLGALLTIMTQSSSAAMAIILTASAGGVVALDLATAAVVGANLGTTSTAIFATLGATSAAKRVAVAHVVFNVLTALVALAFLSPLLTFSSFVAGAIDDSEGVPIILAIFHTVFNCLGVLLIWPLANVLVRYLSKLFESQDEQISRPQFLDNTLVDMPAMAVSALMHELTRLASLVNDFAARRIELQQPMDSDARALQRGLLNLADQVRMFLNRFSAAQLPPEAVRALPDMIRALQHIEELVTLAGDITGSPSGERTQWPRQHLEALRLAAATALDNIVATDQEHAPDSPDAVEMLYQATKEKLLAEAASGRLPVPVMDRALDQAKRWRQAATVAQKIQRRLNPWRGLLDGEKVEVKLESGLPKTLPGGRP
jgi:phosphate:Na+ symporter